MSDLIIKPVAGTASPSADYFLYIPGGPLGTIKKAPLSDLVSTGTLGNKVFYCSTSGVPGGADLSLGSSTFGTDGTAAIQALIDQANATTTVTIYVDTRTSITGLNMKSNVSLVGLPGCGFILRNGSDRPIILPAGFDVTAITTENWHLSGLILNGNRAGQTVLSTPEFGYMVGVGMYGTRNCSVTNCYFTDATMYSMLWVYNENSYIERINIDNGPGTSIYQDGIDIVGYNNAIVRDCYIRTWDDVMAIGSDGLTQLADPNFDSTFYSGSAGECTVYAENITMESTKGFRFISTSNMPHIHLKTLRGTCGEQLLISDNFPSAPTASDNPGPGNFGNIILEDIDVQPTGSAIPGFSGFLKLGGHYNGKLVIKDINRTEFFDDRPTIHFYESGFRANVVEIDGYTATDNEATALNHIYHQYGPIDELNISNVTLKRTEGSNGSALYLSESSASALSVNFNNVLVDGADKVFSSEGGNLYLSAANVRHRGVGTSAASFRTTDTIADFMLSNYYGFVPTSGTFTKTRGDGFAAGGLPTTPPAVSGLTYAYTANVLAPYASGLTIGSAAVTGFNNKGLANQHLPSATDGRIITRMYTGEGGAVVMASAVNAPVTHTALVGCGFSIAAADGSIYQHDGTSATDTGLNITHGHYIAIFRNGTTGAFKLQTSPDKVSWLDLPAPAIAYNSTANIYNPIDILKAVGSPVGDGKLRNPEAQGFI